MRVDELAIAIRHRDALRARALYSELIETDPADYEAPYLSDPIELAIAASMAELIASRRNKVAPTWTRQVQPLPEPYVLVTVRLPEKLERLRLESPQELKARNLVAPDRSPHRRDENRSRSLYPHHEVLIPLGLPGGRCRRRHRPQRSTLSE
jgi:hypothetical protein